MKLNLLSFFFTLLLFSQIGCKGDLDVDFGINGKFIKNSTNNLPPKLLDTTMYLKISKNKSFTIFDLTVPTNKIKSRKWKILGYRNIDDNAKVTLYPTDTGFIKITLCINDDNCINKWIYVNHVDTDVDEFSDDSDFDQDKKTENEVKEKSDSFRINYNQQPNKQKIFNKDKQQPDTDNKITAPPPDKINEPNFSENNQEEPENVDKIVSEEPENTEPENTSITTDQKIEEEINDNEDMDKDIAPATTKAPRSKQIGLSIASRCNNGDYVKNSSCTITPKTDLTLLSLYVYASDIGKVTITVTSSDGTNKSIKVNLNSGRTQILLSELYLDMEKGKKYTIYAKAENERENIVTKLENAKSCAQSYYSNNDISINFNKSVCFFNIKYMVN